MVPRRQLAEICSKYPLEEKILVVPVMSAGRHLTDALLTQGTEWVNLRVETVMSLARSIAASSLAAEGLQLVSRAQSLALVERACLDVLGENSYFSALRAHPGFHQAMSRTIGDLRRAGIDGVILSKGRFEDERKKREVRLIFERYEKLLSQGSMSDVAGMLSRAAATLRSERPKRYDRVQWILAESPERLSPEERNFILLLTSGRHVVLGQGEEPDGGEIQVHAFLADGFENEIREIARRVLSEDRSWDQVEVASIDAPGLDQTLFEILAELDIPATWERGIPVRFTRPGRALLGFLDWVKRDCDAVLLRRLMSSGVLDTGQTGPRLSARLLREAAVGWGRDRYVPRFDARISELKRQTERRPESRIDSRITNTTALKAELIDLIRLVPAGDLQQKFAVARMAKLAREFNEHRSIARSDIDGDAKAAISRVLAEISELETGATISLEETLGRITGIVDQIRVGASHAEPGKLHIASLRGAGWGPRDLVFVPGLTASVFPGGEGQDPILLDRERSSLDTGPGGTPLVLPGGRALRREQDLRDLAHRVEGQVVLSWSSSQTVSPSKEAPASVVLDLYRTGRDPNCSFEQMREALSTERVTCVPSGDPGVVPISRTEAWLKLWKQRGGAGRAWSGIVTSADPMLEAGRLAEEKRSEGTPNPWSGFLSGVHEELDPRHTDFPVSASRLEKLSTCPYSYFLRYVLEIDPLAEMARDPDVWLDPRDYGKLVHDVFRLLMTELTESGEPPSWDAHGERARQIASKALRKLRDTVPPPNQAAFRVREEELMRACEVFLREEASSVGEREPYAFEVAFGWEEEDLRGLGSVDPLRIELGDSAFLIRGQVDRIDRLSDGEWEVIDYKSGSPRPYVDESWLSGGRRLQHALYARAVDLLLQRAGQQGRVSHSGYYFPTVKGQGRRVSKKVPEPGSTEDQLDQKLKDLFVLLREGSFIHSPSEEDCRFCDFREACGNVQLGKSRKLDPGLSGPGVDAWRRVREIEE